MTVPVLSVENLRKTYRRGLSAKKVEALKGVSFSIQPGTVTGFLGANGAGKTTSIKCLLNLAFADSGRVSFFGEPELTPAVKARIGFLPERPYFYEYLTGREFLRFYGELSTSLKTKDLNERIERLLARVGLAHAKDRQLRSYSKGMLQRVGIAQTLIHHPEFIILDEPMTGLDPDGRFEVAEIIRETARSGTAVFFSSHLLPDAERLCNQLVILKLGELVYQGATEDFLKRADEGYMVRTQKAGSELPVETVQTVSDLQKKIDELRRAGVNILEIAPQRVTLEEAFVKIAFDKKGNSP